MKQLRAILGPRDLAGPDAVPPKWKATPYKAVRRAICTGCLARYRVRVSKAFRLREQRSPCCGSQLRAVQRTQHRFFDARTSADHPLRSWRQDPIDLG